MDKTPIQIPGTGMKKEGLWKRLSVEQRAYTVSLAIHLVLVLLLCISSCTAFFPKKKRFEPIVDFTVAIPQEETQEEEPPPEPEKQPEPPPVQPLLSKSDFVEPVKKKEPEKPKKKPIQRSRKIITREPERKIVKRPEPKKEVVKRTKPPVVKGPKLTEEEIQKLLRQGAKPSDHTSIPASEEQRCFSIIRDRIFQAWIKPDTSALSKKPPIVQFTLGYGGIVTQVKLVQSSGNRLLDDSAMSAARSIRGFNALTPGFVRQYPTVDVTFDLQ